MAKTRVHELAKTYGIESKEVLEKLKEMGEFVKSPSSTIELPVEMKFKKAYGDALLAAKATEVADKPAEKAAEKAAEPKPAAKPSASACRACTTRSAMGTACPSAVPIKMPMRILAPPPAACRPLYTRARPASIEGPICPERQGSEEST